MKLAIMQPYFFPYIGYWQLMNVVDKYVIYDDVKFIKGGWINRNRILVRNNSQFINLPMLGSSSNKLINEISVDIDGKRIINVIKTIKMAYKKAPYFHIVFPYIEKILLLKNDNLALFIMNSFVILNEYLGIDTELILSSNIEKNNMLHGQDKVINICMMLGATEYYNAIGGNRLYSKKDFDEKGIKLYFLETNIKSYNQFGNDFVEDLSIIDVMMFCSQQEIKKMLGEYKLL